MSIANMPQVVEGSEYVWEIATFYPRQGDWTEQDYLALSDLTNHPIELADGRIEFLPMPTDLHQAIVGFLYEMLIAFVRSRQLGKVRFSALPVKLWNNKFREPDLLFMATEHLERIQKQFWYGADLVIEIVSENNRKHDIVKKRDEYARTGIPEYWIVDPIEGCITVLILPEGATEYVVHGVFEAGSRAASVVLPGFTVDVTEALAGDG